MDLLSCKVLLVFARFGLYSHNFLTWNLTPNFVTGVRQIVADKIGILKGCVKGVLIKAQGIA
jgi:hypothetical protein